MSTPVTTSWTTITGSAGSFDAYLALPPAGRGPGLLLLQEIFGVNEHIRAVAEQYALDGFVVLAPDVFWQQQRRLDIGYTPEDIQRGRALAMAADRGALQRDLADAAQALRARPEVRGRGIGAIGYCMGGRLAYVAAATAGIDAAVAYYGGGIQDMLDLAPRIALPDAVPLRRARRQHPAERGGQGACRDAGPPMPRSMSTTAPTTASTAGRAAPTRRPAPRWRTAARCSSWPNGCSEPPVRAQAAHSPVTGPSCQRLSCRRRADQAWRTMAVAARAPSTPARAPAPAPRISVRPGPSGSSAPASSTRSPRSPSDVSQAAPRNTRTRAP